ncbi:hypothetical protein MMC30_006316 [Trapelia coarctata]|nr:hypothetical protein [Trapelia coarctata]
MPYLHDSHFSPSTHAQPQPTPKMKFLGISLKKSKSNRKSTNLSAPSPAASPAPSRTPSTMSSKNPYNPFSSRPQPANDSRSPTPQANPGPSTTTPTRRPPPAEAPPAYQPPITTAADNRYAFLSTFDTVFLIDDSGSMAGRSWKETASALASVAPICTQHDADGIDIYFLNHPDSPNYQHITSAASIEGIFQNVRPMGGTPTGSRLNAILKPYLKLVETKGADAVKPLNIIVITDGVPSDDVESVILNAAKKLDRWDAPGWQVGIQFFQVGNEQGAAEALRELDDDLAEIGGEDVRDMVDTVPWSGDSGVGLNADGILKVVLGAVHRKLDRKKESREWRR